MKPLNLDQRTVNQISDAISASFDAFVCTHAGEGHMPSADEGAWKVVEGVWTYGKIFRCSCGETQLVSVKMK